MPKKDLDYMKCEVMRFYRLLTKNCVEPLSMTVPRKVWHTLLTVLGVVYTHLYAAGKVCSVLIKEVSLFQG